FCCKSALDSTALDSIWPTLKVAATEEVAEVGAGEGNRTLVSGLGSPRSTIEPHPRPKRRNCYQSASGGASLPCAGPWLRLIPSARMLNALLGRLALQAKPAPIRARPATTAPQREQSLACTQPATRVICFPMRF